jgi:hypothetical protein
VLKFLLTGGALLATMLFAMPARATVNPRGVFEDPENVAGDPLSNVWNDLPGGAVDTTGVLDIEEVGGTHGRVVKLSANGPDPGPPFDTITAQIDGWGGPSRSNGNGVPGALWYRVDIERGSSDGNTSLTDFIWSVGFGRSNGANIMTLDGGLTTVRFKSDQAGVLSPQFDLSAGWNQLIVKNDTAVSPNTVVYLNGAEVFSFDAGNGPLLSNNGSAPYSGSIQRQGRGGTGDNFVGSMRFDNLITADESLLAMPDVNMDGFVDIFDINLISANWNTIGVPYFVPGDGNKDGIVNIFDINLVSANWAPAPAGSSTAVPEPATWVLLSISLVGLVATGLRRCSP